MMKGAVVCLLVLGIVAARGKDADVAERIAAAKFSPCSGNDHACAKPSMKYERVVNSQPGFQWIDNGGYCGSWAIQRATLAKGAWISQQQVRDHTVASPGAPPSHDHEILSPNIDEALRRLKLKAEGFDYHNSPTPQQPAYFKWLKAHLVQRNPVVWMIMWDGQRYPAYNMTLPSGVHGHIEPVIGIMSNHPLTDTSVYPDDTFVHYTDNGDDTIYKPQSTLSGDWSARGAATAQCHHGSRYCIGPYSYGWAIEGFLDEAGSSEATPAAVPASLKVDPWEREPDFRQHEEPIQLSGTLTVEQLSTGRQYSIYRWDSVEEAFTYKAAYKIASFKADKDTFVYKDTKTFWNNGTTYYRCVAEGQM